MDSSFLLVLTAVCALRVGGEEEVTATERGLVVFSHDFL